MSDIGLCNASEINKQLRWIKDIFCNQVEQRFEQTNSNKL